MKARYVRSLSFEADSSFLPTDDNGRILGEARPIAVQIDDARRAVFLPRASHIHNTLRKAKRPIGDLPIRDVTV